MARVRSYLRLYPWSGGLNTSVDPFIMDPQQLQIADNLIFTNSNTRKKRGGQARFNTTAISTAEIIFVKEYFSNVSEVKKQFFVSIDENGQVFRSNNGVSWNNFSTTALSTSHGKPSAVVFNEDFIIAFSGAAPPQKWDNQDTTANLVALGGTPPDGNIVQINRGRVYLAGDTENPDTLSFSAPNAHETWTGTTAGNIKINPGDGDPVGITAIFPEMQQGGLYVAKRNRLYFVDNTNIDTTLWSIKQISDTIGCVSHNAAVAVDQKDVIFPSDRGVHALSQVLETTGVREGNFLSAPIHEDWHEVISTSDRDKMSAVFLPRRNSYLLSCKRSGQTNFETIYGFNIQTLQWFRWIGTPCNFLTNRFNTTNSQFEPLAAQTAGFINKLDQTDQNDFGVAYCMKLRSSTIVPDLSVVPGEKHVTNLVFIFRSRDNSTFRYSAKVDSDATQGGVVQQRVTGGNVLGTTLLGPNFILGNVRGIKPAFCHIVGVGHSIEVDIEHDTLNADLEILGMYVEFLTDSESQSHLRDTGASV